MLQSRLGWLKHDKLPSQVANTHTVCAVLCFWLCPSKSLRTPLSNLSNLSGEVYGKADNMTSHNRPLPFFMSIQQLSFVSASSTSTLSLFPRRRLFNLPE